MNIAVQSMIFSEPVSR